jgi:hypothetical protein
VGEAREEAEVTARELEQHTAELRNRVRATARALEAAEPANMDAPATELELDLRRHLDGLFVELAGAEERLDALKAAV